MGTHLKYVCFAAMLTAVWGCDKKAGSREEPPPPAKVQNPVKETDLTTITLTAEAEARLGIQTAAVEYRAMEKKRTLGGQVVAVSGRSVVLSAPVSGTLLPPESGSAVTAGKTVKSGQPLYRLLLALPQRDLLSVEEEISRRKAELDFAQAQVKRSGQLLADKAGSAKQLEEAQAQLAAAKAGLETAQTRLELLKKGDLDSADDGLSSLIIKSPVDGVVQEIHVACGQTVTGATALLEMTGLDPVWIKVPVYAGDLAVIDMNAPARVHSLADFTGVGTQTAEPVAAPLSADPNSSTVDLFYELSNANLSYRPGQKVGVTLTLKGTEEHLVVPYPSIVYDMYGSAWVYVRTEPRVYVRQRVEVRYVLNEIAVLSRGPAVGAVAVTAGAAELFGTEFGVREE